MNLRFRCCSAALAPIVVVSMAWAQNSPATGQNSLTLQQQAIDRQLDAVTSKSALKQAESFRKQAESWRLQSSGAQSRNEIATGSISPVADTISTKAMKDPASIGEKPRSLDAQTEPVQAKAGFYTTPWPASPDFVMPNVQVETTACDALGEEQITTLIKDASGKHKVDAALLRAVMVQESGMRPCAVSTAGAMGLMQIMPETADDLGLADPFDPAANVDAGARYLKQMLDRYQGNTALALAAYNAGPGRTDKANGIPQISETIGYVSKILETIPLF